MYRHGLGDCFLLSYSADGGATSHMLIDCGVLKGTDDAARQMEAVAENIRDTTNGRLDVLVATHEHWDHLSGFLQAETLFAEVEVGEVWLAWTENPEDDLATELRRRREDRLRGIVAAADVARTRSTSAAERTTLELDALFTFQGDDLAAGGRMTTRKALDWVKGRQARIRYLQPGQQLFDESCFSGVRVYVLGPPQDRRLIGRSDPSTAHSEVYELAGAGRDHRGFLEASAALAAGREPDAQPFDRFFRLDEADAPDRTRLIGDYRDPAAEWRRIDDDWLGYAGQLALALDSDTNNTSLVLAFELSSDGDVLLFPGDAQVGNWLSWGSLEWRFEHEGRARTVRSADLLARTVLYKVGHHGSHNATLREQGLELMASGELVALIPVNRAMAERKKWRMPFPALYHRLQEKTRGRLIEADIGLEAARPEAGLSAEAWDRFLARTDVQERWIDYTLEW
jgi:hypothetical protein